MHFFEINLFGVYVAPIAIILVASLGCVTPGAAHSESI